VDLVPNRGGVAVTPDSLLTFIDGATGERAEFSAADLGSWVARTASLLRDGCGLRKGDRVALLLPAHWQTAAILLGAYSIGLAVSFRPWSTAGLDPPGEPVEAVFVSRQRLGSWLETVPEAPHRFVLDLAADGVKAGTVPQGYREYLAEVRRYPDPRPEYEAVRPTDPASPDGTSYREWAGLARDLAATMGLRAGDRVLVEAGSDRQPVTWLLAPLTVGASIVVCSNIKQDRLAEHIAEEGVTHVL
jgi:uncharacterized protein (TIGR03089 family)